MRDCPKRWREKAAYPVGSGLIREFCEKEEAKLFDRQRAYRQITRGILGEYNTMKNQLIILPERIETENARLTAIRSSSAESTPVSGSGTNSRQERDIAIIAERDRLKLRLKEIKMEVSCIEKALACLDEMERRTVELIDIQQQKRAIDRLCVEFGYEKTKVYEIHDSALDKFSMLYSGGK